MPSPNFKIALNPEVTLTETQGKLVLFSKKTGDFFGINETALFLLKTFLDSDFTTTLKKGSEHLAVEIPTLEKDLLELITELEQNALIRKIT